MTKTYLLVSLAILAVVVLSAMVFADAGLQLADVSWNSLPTLDWTAGHEWG